MPQAWLDIDIGDSDSHNSSNLQAYSNAVAFAAAVGEQYGLSSAPETYDAEGQQLLQELYEADPTWRSRGPVSCSRPEPIRAGRIVIDLLHKECPRTVANFTALCTGEKGLGKASKKPLHLKGNCFHRIVSGFCAQGGDIVRGDGSGGDSIYGGAFNDEKAGLAMKHELGVVAMANSGKNSNTSQFYFALGPAAAKCDGKHVVFGRVTEPEGLKILARIDAEAASPDGVPRVAVTIADCGLL